MSAKPVRITELASEDVGQAVSFYLAENAKSAAIGFIDALESAYELIGCQPSVGSSRYAHELNLPDLRSWSLQRYPYVVFYIERTNYIEVWRVLHMSRDIPPTLAPPLTSPH